MERVSVADLMQPFREATPAGQRLDVAHLSNHGPDVRFAGRTQGDDGCVRLGAQRSGEPRRRRASLEVAQVQRRHQCDMRAFKPTYQEVHQRARLAVAPLQVVDEEHGRSLRRDRE